MHHTSRSGSGYRLYGKGELNKLRFIRHAKDLGFTLKEIKELLELRISSRMVCEDVRKKTEEKLKMVKQRFEALKSMQRVLEELITACNERNPTEECLI